MRTRERLRRRWTNSRSYLQLPRLLRPYLRRLLPRWRPLAAFRPCSSISTTTRAVPAPEQHAERPARDLCGDRAGAGGVRNADAGRGPGALQRGLRAENTNVGYLGHIASGINDTTAATTQRGNHSYIDIFPSAQVRYALDQNTNLRAAITRGISRPNYPDLAPTSARSA